MATVLPEALSDLPFAAHGAARRALARARRAARLAAGPAAHPQRLRLIGASGATLVLARRLTAARVAVRIVEADADAAARLRQELARQAIPARVDRRATGRAEADIDMRGVAWTLTGGWGAAVTVRLRMVDPGGSLVEVFDGPGADRVAAVAAALGGVPLRVPQGSDGAAARLLARLDIAAEALAFAGAAPWEVDEAAAALGFDPGPCAGMDRLGVDAALARMRALRALRPGLPDPGVVARMVAEGRLGRRASVGFYRYPGGGGRVDDPLIEDLVREEAHFARRAPMVLPADLIGRALVLAVVDEAARLWAEGAVARPDDLDLAAVLGAGFPLRLGGPAALARAWGPDRLGAALRALAAALPAWPDPAPDLTLARVPG